MIEYRALSGLSGPDRRTVHGPRLLGAVFLLWGAPVREPAVLTIRQTSSTAVRTSGRGCRSSIWSSISASSKTGRRNKIPGFYEHLTELIPSLYDHGCSVGKPGGFLQRMREGTWMGHVLEHVALELQNLAGAEVDSRQDPRHRRTRASTTSSSSIEQEDVGLAAGELAAPAPQSPDLRHRTRFRLRASSSKRRSSGSPSGWRMARRPARSSPRRNGAASPSSASILADRSSSSATAATRSASGRPSPRRPPTSPSTSPATRS